MRAAKKKLPSGHNLISTYLNEDVFILDNKGTRVNRSQKRPTSGSLWTFLNPTGYIMSICNGNRPVYEKIFFHGLWKTKAQIRDSISSIMASLVLRTFYSELGTPLDEIRALPQEGYSLGQLSSLVPRWCQSLARSHTCWGPAHIRRSSPALSVL